MRLHIRCREDGDGWVAVDEISSDSRSVLDHRDVTWACEDVVGAMDIGVKDHLLAIAHVERGGRDGADAPRSVD